MRYEYLINKIMNRFSKDMRRFILLLLVLLLPTPYTLYPAFNDNGWGVRPAGMGGAFCAIADDINAPLYNPAGLVQIKKKEATFMYARPYLGLENVTLGKMFLGYAQPVNNGAIGINCTNFDGTELYRENSFSISYAKEIYHVSAGDAVNSVKKATENAESDKIILEEQDFGKFKPYYHGTKGVKFVYDKAPDADKVSLVGDFNDWNPEKDTMERNSSGAWVLYKPLKEGRYEYRFNVDGELKPEENYVIAINSDKKGNKNVKIPMRRKKTVEEYTEIKEEIEEKAETVKSNFYAGVNIKYLTHKYFWSKSEVFEQAAVYYNDPVVASGNSAGAVTADLGIFARLGEKLSVGLVGKNINKPDVGLYYEDKVPSELRAGLAYRIPGCEGILGLDYSQRQQDWGKSSDKMNVHFGAETWFSEHTYGIRLGANKDELTSGVSFCRDFSEKVVLQIDYAIIWSLNISDNSGSHRIGTTVRF
ncbi:MAG: hypothetical protein JW983_10040 [Elusimicrobia bacterium]|nr:hypothetical protein [Elusimicrobiota bacterium]